MRISREIAAVAVVAVLCLGVVLYNASCRQPVPAPGGASGAVKYEPQRYEIAAGSNVIAQVAGDCEIEADVHLADRPEPVRAVIRLKAGTWLMPEQMYIIEDGGEIICNRKYCEVKQ